MRGTAFLVPGRLDARTGGSIYDRRMVDGLRQRGWRVEVHELDESFPYPMPAALDRARHVLASLPRGTSVIVDGLAFGAMPALVEREAARLRFVALVHLPLAATIGLDPATSHELEASERRALAVAGLVIVSGTATMSLLAQYDVAQDKVVVIEPGTDRVPLSRGSGDSTPQLISVATLNPGKGHEILFRALAAIRHTNWHLTCVGSTRHAPTVDRLRTLLRCERLEQRVELVGELDEAGVAAAYDRADVFVLATLRETYGMAVAEALARGLPVVSTRTGAIADLVGDEAGLLVPPGNVEALTEALSRVLGDTTLRVRLAAGARRVRDRLPGWESAFDRMSAALEQVSTDG